MDQTPYYLIDREKLLLNMAVMDRVREGKRRQDAARLKCFATWSVFDTMNRHMDGTTSSSLQRGEAGGVRSLAVRRTGLFGSPTPITRSTRL